MLQSFLKKDTSSVSADADAAAIDLFSKTNSRMADFSLDINAMSSTNQLILNHARSLLYGWFGGMSEFVPDAALIAEGFDTGPGASNGVKGCTFYHKVASGPLTSTSESLSRFYRASLVSPVWQAAEIDRSAHFGDVTIVPGSKLTTVPKTSDISRVICTEPSLNMMFQKGIGAIIERGLRRRIGIDLSEQPRKNASLAQRGSLAQSFGTIDLKSASDSISLTLCKWLLPEQLFNWCLMKRSPSATLPSGESLELHMISSMGNAFTFPLQTAIFSSIVLAAYHLHGVTVSFPRGKDLGNFGVFGDDIICLSETYDTIVSALQCCGFEVNLTKSYNEGDFRESCGSDYFRGHNIRPVFLTDYIIPQDKISLFNRLARWSVRTGISIPYTLNHVYSDLSRRDILFVPPYEDDCAGIHVPFHFARANKVILYGTNVTIKYRRFVVKSRIIRLKMDGTWQVFKRRTLHLNPMGVFLAALRGDLLGVALESAPGYLGTIALLG